jgi:hypothetical protein
VDAVADLKVLLAQQGDTGAQSTDQAVSSEQADDEATATFELGRLLGEQGEQGDLAGARVAYERVIESEHVGQAPRAAVNLGNLLRAGRPCGRARRL